MTIVWSPLLRSALFLFVCVCAWDFFFPLQNLHVTAILHSNLLQGISKKWQAIKGCITWRQSTRSDVSFGKHLDECFHPGSFFDRCRVAALYYSRVTLFNRKKRGSLMRALGLESFETLFCSAWSFSSIFFSLCRCESSEWVLPPCQMKNHFFGMNILIISILTLLYRLTRNGWWASLGRMHGLPESLARATICRLDAPFAILWRK
jgi:hypothetical protein